MYLTRYERWKSPLYLVGESYGTTRAAGLAGHLVDQGHRVQRRDPGLLRPRLSRLRLQRGQRPAVLRSTLPSYTATAWYHKKLPADLPAPEPGQRVLEEAGRGPRGSTPSILEKGDQLSPDERARGRHVWLVTPGSETADPRRSTTSASPSPSSARSCCGTSGGRSAG